MKRFFKILGIVVVILIVIVIAVPFFIDANIFRPTLESELTSTLGRQVKVGNLSLALWSGSVKADNISISDDHAFSNAPFVKAQSLKVGVELIPLIFSKTLNVTDLTLDSPQINLIRTENGDKWNFSSLGNTSRAQPASAGENQGTTKPGETAHGQSKPSESKPTQPSSTAANKPPASKEEQTSSGNPNISVSKLRVNNGQLTINTQGSGEKARGYDKVNISVDNFSFNNSFPFKLSADLPGGGTLNIDGSAGPVNPNDAAQTPLNAKVQIHQMNLADSGFIDPASGIAGIADFSGTVGSDGHMAKTSGTLIANKLQVVKKGSPAGKPVTLKYAVNYDITKQSGDLSEGDVSLGKALAHLTGNYNAHGKVTTVNMKLNGDGMPVDDLEAMLPAVGVVLPSGSRLKGGTLNTNFTIVGPVDKLVTAGTVKLQNSALAGFNLGQKLSAIPALSGKNSGNDTAIQNFSADVHMAPEGTQAQNINLTIPSIGELTGAGNVNPQNAIDFKMLASLTGSAVTGAAQMVGLGSKGGSIPFLVEGTTSDPKFRPDVQGLAKGFLKNLTNGQNGQQQQKNPLSGLSGLFKKPK
ncbi:MAG TPA: AsmA family protein [Candidatus Sulfotelmatobacter sp.]|nr:AsmA family protein [Candidatus Sulfotelmatobacter sp.]